MTADRKASAVTDPIPSVAPSSERSAALVASDDGWLDPDQALAAAEPWGHMCGPCDIGLPMGCTCPPGDPRAIISRLASVIEHLRAQAEANEARDSTQPKADGS